MKIIPIFVAPETARAVGSAPAHGMCAATACPLIAPNGSPWTGEKDAVCEGSPCGFFNTGNSTCDGTVFAHAQVGEAHAGSAPLQLAMDKGGRYTGKEAKTYDCPIASNCQWQMDSKMTGHELCPPRTALAKGVDPRYSLF